MKELQEIKISKNELGFFDVLVNGEVVLEMLGADEIADSAAWLMNGGFAEITEMEECAYV